MNKLEVEIKKLIEEREAALNRMHDEFDRADSNNSFAQAGIAKMISDLTSSLEELKRFESLVSKKALI